MRMYEMHRFYEGFQPPILLFFCTQVDKKHSQNLVDFGSKKTAENADVKMWFEEKKEVMAF